MNDYYIGLIMGFSLIYMAGFATCAYIMMPLVKDVKVYKEKNKSVSKFEHVEF